MCRKEFMDPPTHVIHIFKVRRGHYNNIRLYVNFDRGTCRLVDYFVSDNQGVILPVADTNIEILLSDNKSEKIEDAIPLSDLDF